MKRFTAAGITWLFLLVAGAAGKFFLQAHNPRPALNWLANHSLSANHQIREADLKKPASLISDDQLIPEENIIGLHLLHDKNEDNPITLQDLSPTPELSSIGDDCFAFVYNLDATELATADLVQSGSRLRFCAAQPVMQVTQDGDKQHAEPATCLNTPIEVVAVHRNTSGSSKDWLLLKVPLAHAGEFATLLTGKPRFLLITSKPSTKAL